VCYLFYGKLRTTYFLTQQSLINDVTSDIIPLNFSYKIKNPESISNYLNKNYEIKIVL